MAYIIPCGQYSMQYQGSYNLQIFVGTKMTTVSNRYAETLRSTIRSGFGVAVVNDMIYVIGGYIGPTINADSDDTKVLDVSKLGPEYSSNEPCTTKADLDSARNQVGVGVLGDTIFAIGGELRGRSVILNSHEEYTVVPEPCDGTNDPIGGNRGDCTSSMSLPPTRLVVCTDSDYDQTSVERRTRT